VGIVGLAIVAGVLFAIAFPLLHAVRQEELGRQKVEALPVGAYLDWYGRYKRLWKRIDSDNVGRADLKRLRSLDSADKIPITGRGLVIVAEVKGVLHFRVFDKDGVMAMDTDEKGVALVTEGYGPPINQEGEIARLRKQLESVADIDDLPSDERRRLMNSIFFILSREPFRITREPLRLDGKLAVVDLERKSMHYSVSGALPDALCATIGAEVRYVAFLSEGTYEVAPTRGLAQSCYVMVVDWAEKRVISTKNFMGDSPLERTKWTGTPRVQREVRNVGSGVLTRVIDYLSN
jgi:hypothetical protein